MTLAAFQDHFRNPSSNLGVSVVSIKPEKMSQMMNQTSVSGKGQKFAATASGEAQFAYHCWQQQTLITWKRKLEVRFALLQDLLLESRP